MDPVGEFNRPPINRKQLPVTMGSSLESFHNEEVRLSHVEMFIFVLKKPGEENHSSPPFGECFFLQPPKKHI